MYSIYIKHKKYKTPAFHYYSKLITLIKCMILLLFMSTTIHFLLLKKFFFHYIH